MNNVYFKIGLISITAALMLAGCSDSQQGKFTEEQMKTIPYVNKNILPQTSGGMALAVYSETITAQEILGFTEKNLKPYAEKTDWATFQTEAAPHIRETIKGKVTDILLYREAKKTAPANIEETLEKAVETEISRFVSAYDNNYALAERAITEMGMDWKAFREYEKKLLLTQSYISTALKEEKRFSYRDLQDYYESIKAEQFTQVGLIEFSLIDLIPAKLTDDQIAEGQTRQAAATRIAAEILRRLNEGEDFAALAKQYSHTMAAGGGKWTPHTIGSGSLSAPYDQLEGAAMQMQPGQINGPLTVEDHVFILRLDKIQHGNVKPFPEVQKQIEQQLQFQHRQQQYLELIKKLIAKADIVQLEQFAAFCTAEAYHRWGRDRQQVSAGSEQLPVNSQ